jgi:hypothetical protein
VDGVDDLGAVDALQVDRRDAEIGVPELALNYDQRYAFVRHLDRVRVSQLMRSKSPSDAGQRSGSPQLLPSCRWLPMPASGRAADDAEQGANG